MSAGRGSSGEQGSFGLFEGVGRPVHDRALGWVSSRRLSTEGCIERLAGIDNDAVNQAAKTSELGRMRDEADVLRYIETTLEALAPHPASRAPREPAMSPDSEERAGGRSHSGEEDGRG